ncbi:MAG: DUF6498-containing protein [Candidatus Gracilibacteria bacterium]|jgi:hypothetical protein
MVSYLLLVASNLVPLAGVLYFDWSVSFLLLLYWCETGIMGFYNIFKIAKANSEAKISEASVQMWGKMPSLKGKLIMFFMFHFGVFMFAHLIFILIFVVSRDEMFSLAINDNQTIRMFFYSLLGLFLSHGYSFKANFIDGGEWKRINPLPQMVSIYSRVILMHLILFVSAACFILLHISGNKINIAIMVVIKILLDLVAHYKSHKKLKLQKLA